MVALLSSQRSGELLNDDIKEIEAINAFAETESRDLSAEEATRQEELLEKIEQNKGRLAKAKKFEEFCSARDNNDPRQSEAQAARVPKFYDEPRFETPRAIAGVDYNLKSFRGQHANANAYAAGMQIWAMSGNESAKRWCDDNGVRFNAAQTTTNTEGGFTVPDPVSASIIDVRERVGLLRQIADIYPMSADVASVPKLASGPSVGYPGEAAAISLTDLVFSNIALAVVKRATLTKVSRELSADSLIRIADRVANRAAYALSGREDEEFISGDGTASYGSGTGIVAGNLAGGRVTASGNLWSEIVMGDFHSMLAKLPEEFHDAAEFVCSRNFYHSVMEKLLVAAGGATVSESVDGPARKSVLGYPVRFTGYMPVAEDDAQQCLFLGDWKQSVILGERDGVEIATSDEYAFNEDVTTVRVTSRYDINCHNLSSASAAGGVVSLLTAAS